VVARFASLGMAPVRFQENPTLILRESVFYMNKIDVLLNSISQKHLRVEVLDRWEPEAARSARVFFSRARIHAALLDAFEGGVRHAGRVRGNATALLKEVDIDLCQLERLEMMDQLCNDI
jgi:hypothetical protein